MTESERDEEEYLAVAKCTDCNRSGRCEKHKESETEPES